MFVKALAKLIEYVRLFIICVVVSIVFKLKEFLFNIVKPWSLLKLESGFYFLLWFHLEFVPVFTLLFGRLKNLKTL